MTRFIIPILMYATAGYMYWYNGQHGDRKLLFPFLDMFASYKGNIPAQAALSFQILCGIATLMLLWAVFDYVRALRTNPPATRPEE